MQLATVIGSTTATVKHDCLHGTKLMIVVPRQRDGRGEPFPLIAIDNVGCGIGETVMITSDGRFNRQMLDSDNVPVRWSIVGIRDSSADPGANDAENQS